MLFDLIGKLVAAPVRIANIPIKVIKAAGDAMCSDPVRFEDNALDDIAEVIEKSVKKIGE